MVEIGVIGVNSRSCPLEVREKLTTAFLKCFDNNSCDLFPYPYVLLSTCHRIEVYFSGKDLPFIHVLFIALIRKIVKCSFEHYLYSFFESDVYYHLAKVTCGFDSAIIGESDIQRQVKLAYEHAKNSQKLSYTLHYLFQKSLKIGKDVRSTFGSWKKEFNLEDLILGKISQMTEDRKVPILLIGNSYTCRNMISLLLSKNYHNLTLITRSPISANFSSEIVVKSREELFSWDEYPVVISATTEMAELLEVRESYQNQKRVVFDLSLPRTVHSMVEDQSHSLLLNIEDLSAEFIKKQESFKSELLVCEKEIEARAIHVYLIFQNKICKKKALGKPTY